MILPEKYFKYKKICCSIDNRSLFGHCFKGIDLAFSLFLVPADVKLHAHMEYMNVLITVLYPIVLVIVLQWDLYCTGE